MIAERVLLCIIFATSIANTPAAAQQGTVYTVDIRCDRAKGEIEIQATAEEDPPIYFQSFQKPASARLLEKHTFSNVVNGELAETILSGQCDLKGRVILIGLRSNSPRERGMCSGDWSIQLLIEEDGQYVVSFPRFADGCLDRVEAYRVVSRERDVWEACARFVDYALEPSRWRQQCVTARLIDSSIFHEPLEEMK